MADLTLTQGQTFTDTAGNPGIAQFDPNTGKSLAPGASATVGVPAPAPQPTAGDVYGNLGLGTYDQTPDNVIAAGLARSAAAASATPDENQIYQGKLAQYQAEIDATNKIYAEKLAANKLQDTSNIGSATATEARSGLLGSDFGTAQTQKVTDANNTSDNLITQEQSSKIAAILGLARTDAASEIAAKRDAQTKGTADYLSYLGAKTTRSSDNANKVASALLANKVDTTQVDPAHLADIAKNYGIAPSDIVAAYKTQKQSQDATAQAASDAHLKDINGLGYDISPGSERVQYNPKTGNYDTINGPSKILSPTEAAALGVPYGTTETQAAGMSNTTNSNNKDGTQGSPTANASDFNKGVPINANGAATSGNSYDQQAFALATGLAAPSQYITARNATTPAGKGLIDRANTISMAITGQPFNPEAAQAAYKFRTSQQYQRLTANIPTAIQTIVQAAQAAKSLNLTGIQSLNSLKIQADTAGLNPFASPQENADAQSLKSLLALNQDDLGLILGTGSGSDLKTKLGGLIFDPTGAPMSTDQLTSTIVNKITDKLAQYYQAAGDTQARVHATLTAQQLVNDATAGKAPVDTSGPGGASPTASNPPSSAVVQTKVGAINTNW
jgi:hypothetical protein